MIIVALLILSFTLSVFANPPRITVPFVSTAPSIDGQIDETIWENAPIIREFAVAGSENPAPIKTETRILCDKEYLYFAFFCEEPALDKVREAMKDFDKANWNAELVEIQFDIPHGEPRYREIMVNPNGFGEVGYVFDEEAAKTFRSAATYQESAWIAECALPLAAFGIETLNTQVVWGANIRRFRTYFDDVEDVSYQWMGNPHGFRDTARYAELIIGPETGVIIETLRVEATGVGPENPVPVRFTNTGQPRPVAVHTSSEDKENEEITKFEMNEGELEGAASITLEPEPTKQKIHLKVIDEQSGETLYSRFDHTHIPPRIVVEFTDPVYRGLLEPTDKELKGVVSLGLSQKALNKAKMEIAIINDSRILYSEKIRIRSQIVEFSIKASHFAEGLNQLLIAAVGANGETLASEELPIRKTTEESFAKVHSRVDEHLRLVVDGEPFFPLGWYSGRNQDHLKEIAEAGPFNCILDYGMNRMSFDEIQEYLDLANKLDMKILYCCNDLYPESTHIPEKSVWSGNKEIGETTIRAFRDHPAIIAWYLNDELPMSMLPGLHDYYNMFRRDSPDLPTFIVHYKTQVLEEMGRTTDILGLDHYPVPRDTLTGVSDFIDQGYAAVNGKKPVWMVLQAFAWYQYREPKKPVEGNPRARIPTAEELSSGRAPTKDEMRCMTYLALTHNAKSLIYYCYYDLRVLPEYEEMWESLKEIGSEVKTLFPALLSTETIPTQCEDSRIHHLARANEGKITILTVNGTSDSGTATVSLDKQINGEAEVLFENRTVQITDGKLTDNFGPTKAHIYQIK